MPKPLLTLVCWMLFLGPAGLACAQETTPAIPPSPPDFQLVKTRTVQIGGARHILEDSILLVPENRQRPGSRLLRLPVRRIRCQGPQAGEPVFWLNGGPGASNIKYKPSARLLAHHDLVMVGYRGVDGDTRLDGREIRRALAGARAWFSPEAELSLQRAMAACSRRLQADGVDLEGYTVPEVVADLEAARRAFGYARIQLLGASYGTRVALLYAQAHPETVLRSCLLGANPPGHLCWQSATADRLLHYYSRLDAENHTARKETLEELMRRVRRNLPRSWLGIPIDPGRVRVLTFLMLYHRGSAATVFDAYRAAGRGDASGLALMSLVSGWIVPRALNWADFYSKGVIDQQPGRGDGQQLDPDDAVIGAPLSRMIWAHAWDWPDGSIPEHWKTLQPSNVPTLVVSGSVDFSTPAEVAADELLPKLCQGRQIVLAEVGHVDDMLKLRPQAMETLLASYFDDGRVEASGFQYVPMDFRVGLGFPGLAKILVILGGVLIALALVMVFLLAMAWLPVRRVEKNQ